MKIERRALTLYGPACVVTNIRTICIPRATADCKIQFQKFYVVGWGGSGVPR